MSLQRYAATAIGAQLFAIVLAFKGFAPGITGTEPPDLQSPANLPRRILSSPITSIAYFRNLSNKRHIRVLGLEQGG